MSSNNPAEAAPLLKPVTGPPGEKDIKLPHEIGDTSQKRATKTAAYGSIVNSEDEVKVYGSKGSTHSNTHDHTTDEDPGHWDHGYAWVIAFAACLCNLLVMGSVRCSGVYKFCVCYVC